MPKRAESTDYVSYAFAASFCDLHGILDCGDWRYFTYRACMDTLGSGARDCHPAELCDMPIDSLPEETTFAEKMRRKPSSRRKINGHTYVLISAYPMPSGIARDHAEGIRAGGFHATVIKHRDGYWVYRREIKNLKTLK